MTHPFTIRLAVLLVVLTILIFALKGNFKEPSDNAAGNSLRISKEQIDSYDSVKIERSFPKVSKWIAAGIGDGGFYRCIRYNPVHHDTVYLCGDRSGMDRSTDYGSRWTPINNGITNYYVEDLAVDPHNGEILLAGTAGGILKTTDAGNNWTIKGTNVTGIPDYTVKENVAISAVAINKGNSNYWYAGTSTYAGHPEGNRADTIQVYKSTDRGETWTNMLSSYTGTYRYQNMVMQISPDPKNVNVVYIATQDAVLKTTDGGSSWFALTNHYKAVKDSYYKGSWWVEIDPKNSNIVYSAPYMSPWAQDKRLSRVAVLKSTDAGSTWNPATSGIPDGRNISELHFDPLHSTWLYAGDQAFSTGNCYRTTDGGNSWKEVGTTRATKLAWQTSRGSFNSFDVYGKDIIKQPIEYRSTDAGESWFQSYTLYNGDGTYSTTGTDGQSLYGTYITPGKENVIYGEMADQSARKSTDFGKSWKSLTTTMGIFSTSDGTPCKSTKELIAKAENISVMWASQTYHGNVNEGIMIKSTDGGASWFKYMGGLPEHHINYLKYKGGDTLFCFPHWSGIWRTTNGGESWSLRQSAPGNGDNNTEGITISPVNRNFIYFSAAASGNGFYASTDGGTSFTKVSRINRVNAIAAHPDSLGIVWTARYSTLSDTGKGGLWKSTNNGLTWTKKFTIYSYEGYSTPIPNFSGIIYGKTSNVMYACTKDLTPNNGLWLGQGVWKSIDYGEHWTEYNTGIGTKNVTGIAIDRVNNILYISTDSRSTEIRNENYKE